MNLSRQSLPAGLAILALSLAACNSASMLQGAGSSDPRLSGRIDKAYAARDACLSKNAAPTNGEPDVASVAKAVSLSCMPETNRLIAVTNPQHDPQVTEAILRDTDTKAVRYVMLARGEGWN